ncbi:protein rep [Capnocytophaga canis]|uniref:Uncharacterized protein n=1 Tax=Capnocytophaga canis TaxID=1848903 RepID=A0A0B7IMU5_9FLAO|nr:protein rep [Capnocytophaga canis]CEN51949.1 hypothetical protein CCAND93_20053 [Capnocytophaga canis]
MCKNKNFDQLYIVPDFLKEVRKLPTDLAKVQAFTRSLDTNGKFVRGETQNLRLTFEKMRRYSGSILVDEKDFNRGFNSTCTCGIGRISKEDKTPVALVRGVESQKVFFNGLVKCGSVWRCPVCGFKVMKHRQNELYYMSSEWLRRGFKISFVTLTIRHRPTFTLEKSLDILLSEFRKMQNTKVFDRLELEHDVTGFVRTLEITWGESNGWHPHLHLLVFHKSDNFDSLHSDFIDCWTKRKRVGALKCLQKAKRVYDTEGLVDYVTKWDMTKEMTRSHFKEPKTVTKWDSDLVVKGERYTPFSMLRRLALDEFDEDSSYDRYMRGKLHWLFVHYCKATKGKHFIVVSKKMKAFFREIANEDMKTDEEILRDEKVDDILVKIDTDLWDDFTKDRRFYPAYLLNAYENEGVDGVINFFTSAGYLIDYDSDRRLILPKSQEQMKISVPKGTIVYVRNRGGEWKIRRFCDFARNGRIKVFCDQYDPINNTSVQFFSEYSFDNPLV